MLAVDDNSRFLPVSSAGWKDIEDCIVVVNLASGSSYELNGVEATVWKKLAAGDTVAETARSVCAGYDAPIEKVRKDIDLFIEELLNENLVSAAEPREAIQKINSKN